MKTETFLPIFTGFYSNSIWEADEQSEIDYINDQRSENNLNPIEWDEVNFEYSEYETTIAEKITDAVESLLTDYVRSIKFEKVVSPNYYNFSNDSINCVIDPKRKEIKNYLKENSEAFEKYLKDQHTSRDGFISFQENTTVKFMENDPLNDSYKLGCILNFIAENEGISEFDIYNEIVDFPMLRSSNYEQLIN